jgi:hypothetical protein
MPTTVIKLPWVMPLISLMAKERNPDTSGSDVSQAEMQNLLDHLTLKTSLLEALSNFHTNIHPGEFGFEKAFPHCQHIPVNLLQKFKLAINNVYNQTALLSKAVVLKAKDSNEGKSPTLSDVKLLIEVIDATNELFNNPADKKCYYRFNDSIAAVNPTSFNYQALVGNSLVVVAVVTITLLFPVLAVTGGFPLGLGVALLGTMAGFLGQAIARESQKPRPRHYLQDTKLTNVGEKLKTITCEVISASGRYGFFSLFDTSTRSDPHPNVVLHSGGIPILTR